MKKISSVLLAAALAVSLLAGCSSTAPSSNGSSAPATDGSKASETAAPSSTADALSGVLKMSGSTSMEKVVKGLNGKFMEDNKGVTVDLQLGGSGAGISAASEGKADIGNSSRKLKDEEATTLTANVMAYDGIAVVVNVDNKVEDITLEQLQQIYAGEIRNWKDLGGADEPIVVIGREEGSGTRDGFESIVMGDKAPVYAQELAETGTVINNVAQNKDAVGYASLASVDDSIKALKVEGVAPSEETVKDGTFKIMRPFIMAVAKDSTNELTQAYLDFVFSAEGQEIVRGAGLVPVN